MKTLNLEIDGLDDADRRLLQVFLRFAGRGDGFTWSLATGGEADLMLRAAPADGDFRRLRQPDGGATAWVLGRDQTVYDGGVTVLRRPLQIDALTALLRARERQLERRGARAQAVADVAADDSAVTRPAALLAPAPASAPSPAARPRPPAWAPADLLTVPAALDELRPIAPRLLRDDGHTAYRLLKWPTSDMLRGRPKFVRMLGFLSHKPLSVERLAVLSGVDEPSCREMLGLLDAQRLLARSDTGPDSDLHPAGAQGAISDFAHSASHDDAAATRPMPGRRAPPPPPSGLFQRLRQRLGLSL